MLNKNEYHLIDVVDGLKTIPDNSADIIIIDPPYNIGKDFGINKDDLDLNHYLLWCDEWINESIRILKDSGTIYIYGFSEILAYISVRIKLPKRWLIWHYTNKTTPKYNGWQRSHESILYVYKDKPIFNRDDIRVPYSKSFLKNSAGKKRPVSKTARFGDSADTLYNAHSGGALPRDVITDISTLAGGAGKERFYLVNDEIKFGGVSKDDIDKCIVHPTQKPMKLTEKLIKASKPQNDCFVVIPFGGSGSEGLVCKKMGINFIGFDNNPDFITLSNKVLTI